MKKLAALALVVSAVWSFVGCGDSDDPGQVCSNTCAKLVQLGCGDDDCVAQCTFTLEHTGECQSQVTALFQCATDNATSCQLAGCADEQNAVVACGGKACLSSSGTIDNDNCTATSGCSTGATKVACKGTACTCSLGGAQVGTCTDTKNACDAEHGCCAQFF